LIHPIASERRIRQGACLTPLAADGGWRDHEPPWLKRTVRPRKTLIDMTMISSGPFYAEYVWAFDLLIPRHRPSVLST